MSVFPAYANVAQDEKKEATDSWLKNSSFQINVLEERGNHQSDTEESKEKESITSVSLKKSKKTRKQKEISTVENSVFFIDKTSTREYLNVKTISRPAVAKYAVHYYLITKKRKNRKFKRYFQQPIVEETIDKQNDESISKNTANLPSSSSENFDLNKHDEELSQTTAVYNKTVYNEPNNINIWLKFIDFQDTVFKSEKTFKKGSLAKGLRVYAERKLDILEKAIFHNPSSEDLHRKRLQILVSVYPADELQKKLKELLQKDQGNIILWQGYIEATQCSMSHCNTLEVLKLYKSCLLTLHKIRRTSISDSKLLEESILRILYQCGLFLKQSGLFEQLWTLLKMYLQMNLGQMIPDSFDIKINIDEKQLLELEDVIFKSQLPSHELWLRTEKLRESCHWLPVTAHCEDPQRIIFTEDVVELIQPITVPENTFRLTATILTLLKIPLLPCRHSTMQQLGLDYVPWALDSIETLLPIFYSIYPLDLNLENFLIDYKLSVGPQYLKVLPGQEEYLDFILKVMHKCIDYLEGEDKYSIIIWWFRFQRLLIILDKKQIFKLPPNVKKSIKSKVKNLLKKPENRNSILFYVEYALIEKELNSTDSCIEILEIALSFIAHLKFDSTCINKEQESACYLMRILVETMIHEKNNDKAIKYLINFVLEKPIKSECSLDENTLTEASLKFKHITLQLLSKIELQKLPPVKHMLPIFISDWIICNGWFIFLTKGPLECGTFLEGILEKLDEQNCENFLEKEIIYEFYIAVIFKFCLANPGYGLFKALDDILVRALQCFPNNLFFLSVMAKEQFLLNSIGPKLWKMKNLLLKAGHALPVLILISITHQVIRTLQAHSMDTFTNSEVEIENTSFKNAMLSLFKSATKSNMCTRRCGLIWRLYLQFVHKHCEPKLCRQVYYCAVEECPWLKALYIDAAIYIPAELGQIQDLIIEKQLRIHTTPEEVEILRD